DDQQQRNRQNRRTQQENNAGGVVRPDEQRQTVPGHARGAHAVDGHNEVQSGQNGRESYDEDGKPGLNHFGIAEGGAEGSVKGPARIGAAGQDAVQHQSSAADEQIPTQEIDSRECKVFGADHQWHEEIPQNGGDG